MSVHASHPHWTSTTKPVRLCIHSFCIQWQIPASVDWLSGLRSAKNKKWVWRTRFLVPWPETLFLPTSTALLTPVGLHSKNDECILFDRCYHWLLLALLDVSYSGALQISRWFLIPIQSMRVLLVWFATTLLSYSWYIVGGWYKQSSGFIYCIAQGRPQVIRR